MYTLKWCDEKFQVVGEMTFNDVTSAFTEITSRPEINRNIWELRNNPYIKTEETTKTLLCRVCDGSGGDELNECFECKGKGAITKIILNLSIDNDDFGSPGITRDRRIAREKGYED